MLGSITDTFSSFVDNFVNNFVNSVMDLAPNLITTALATAANSALPGSGVLVQAFAGPVVNAGVDAFGSAFRDTIMPALTQSFTDGNVPDIDVASLADQLGSTFLNGIQQGWTG